jgi:hypothetical protein
MCFISAGRVDFNHMFFGCKVSGCVVLTLCLMSFDGSKALGAFLSTERTGVLSTQA